MRAIAIILFICFSTYSFAQKHKEKAREINDSIAALANLLSGEWALKGYFENGQFKETKLSTIYSKQTPGEKLVKFIADSGMIVRKYMNDSLISIEKSDELDVFKMEFKSNGTGTYIEYVGYNPNKQVQSIKNSKLEPSIQYIDGKYILHFLLVGAESDINFKVRKDELIFFINSSTEKLYRRLK